MQTRTRDSWSDTGSPGSRATSFHTCQVLRPRRVIQALALTRLSESPCTFAMVSAPGTCIFAGLNGWPMRSLADASLPPSRTPTHGSGSMWIATPSSYRTYTDYSLPVSRRTAKNSGHYPRTGNFAGSERRRPLEGLGQVRVTRRYFSLLF